MNKVKQCKVYIIFYIYICLTQFPFYFMRTFLHYINSSLNAPFLRHPHLPLLQLAASECEHSRFHNQKAHKSATEHINLNAGRTLHCVVYGNRQRTARSRENWKTKKQTDELLLQLQLQNKEKNGSLIKLQHIKFKKKSLARYIYSSNQT